MKRSGFKVQRPPGMRPARAATQIGEGYTLRPRPAAVAVAGPARAVMAVPKGIKARPGKAAPTAEERAWMNAITFVGCIACLIDGHPGTPGAVHHLLRGGHRIGHLFSICLCQPGHHMDGQHMGLVSRHPFKARFEARYGSEAELLRITRNLTCLPV